MSFKTLTLALSQVGRGNKRTFSLLTYFSCSPSPLVGKKRNKEVFYLFSYSPSPLVGEGAGG